MDQNTAMSVGSIEDVLKVVYEPVVRKTFKNHNALSAELKREDVTTRLGEGNYVHISLELSEGAGAGGRPEFGELPKAVPGEFIHSRVQVKYLYAPGAISGPALKKAQSSRQALINSLAKEVKNTSERAERMFNIALWGGEHGAIAEIDTVTATNGGSPWELELTEDQPFYGRYFKRGERLQFGSVTGGVATVEPGVVKVTAIDRANRTITVETVSGSPDPTAGDKVFVEGTANAQIQGLDQIITDQTTKFQNVDPSDYPEDWKAVRKDNNNNTISVRALDEFLSEIAFNGDSPDLLITTKEICRDLYEELDDKVRYSKPDNLKAGNWRVELPTGQVLRDAYEAKLGSVFAINTDELSFYDLGDWEYLTQGGDKMMRLSRVDAVEIQLARYANLACRKRNAHGELHGVKNDTHL